MEIAPVLEYNPLDMKLPESDVLEITGKSKIEIAPLIKSIRKEQELTQQEMAEVLGVSRSTYEYWETGKFTPDGERLVYLLLIRAKKRNLKLQELFS